MPDSIKRPGEFWWACHPWFSRVRFLQSDGSPVSTRSLQQQNARHVQMEVKPHPVLILGPGDESVHGYLVCYLSSHQGSADPIQRKALHGVQVNNDGRDCFMFCMAPCYCPDEFVWRRIRLSEPPLMELVKGVLKRACRLARDQTWDCFTFEDIEGELSPGAVEDVRKCMAEVFNAIRHAQIPAPEEAAPIYRQPPPPDAVLDGAVMPDT